MANTIRNCSENFKVTCPLLWENLKPTESKNVRYCNGCEQRVYFCENDEETLSHALQNHCVARNDGINVSETRGVVIMGMPNAESIREGVLAEHRRRKELAINESIKSNSAKLCPKCSFPMPESDLVCKVCEYS